MNVNKYNCIHNQSLFNFANSSEMITNSLGKTFPKFIDGYGECIPFNGCKCQPHPMNASNAIPPWKLAKPGEVKILTSLE